MQSTAAQLYSPHRTLHCAMVEAITPDSVTDGVSTEELDENLCNTVSPGLSDEIVDQSLSALSSQLNPPVMSVATTGYSPPPVHLSPSTLNKNSDKKWNLVKVCVGFDVTRKGERSLVIDGYKFTKSRDGMGDRVFWRCSRRECKATAVTVSDRVEHIRAVHSHQPPVAAEFFAENTTRCEQEVRFNNAASYPRSRVRRRSQPNPLDHPHPLKLDDNSPISRHSAHTISTNTTTTMRTQTFEPGQFTSANSKVFEQVSPEPTLDQPANASLNGFTAQTLTALITHLVETNPNAKSLRAHNSLSESNGIELPPASSTSEVVCATPCDTRCVTQKSTVINYKHDQTNSPTSLIQSTECDAVSDNRSGASGLEQLAAIATSFANSVSTMPDESTTYVEPNLKSNLLVPSMAQVSHTPISSASSNELSEGHPVGAHLKCVSTANVLTPGAVGFIGKNSQGQLVVLTGEQLSELLRTQQSLRNSYPSDCTGTDGSLTNGAILGSTPLPSLTQLSTLSPSSWHQQYSTADESQPHTTRTDPCEPSLSSNLSSNQPHAAVTNEGVNQWTSSAEALTTDPRDVLSRLDGLPKSLSCIVSMSNKSPDARIQPIMVTALQVQPPGSPVNSVPTSFQSLGPELPMSARRLLLTEIARSEGSLSGPEYTPPVCSINDVFSPHHATVHGKVTTPGLLVHWKKEKMRESYPDEEHSDVVHVTQSTIPYTARPTWYVDGRKRQSSAGIYDDGPRSKISCCCDDSLSKIHSTAATSANNVSLNESVHPTQATDLFNPSCIEASTYPTQPQHHSLTVSTGLDEEQTLCNQVQDGVLVKVLNTVQQLTAKLDADADPPEVIQNCRAIQACLDTIAAIKRVRSASGTCSPKIGSDPPSKVPPAASNGFEDSTTSVHTAAQNRSGFQSGGCQNLPERQITDSSRSILPV